jgi:hypothetical protein
MWENGDEREKKEEEKKVGKGMFVDFSIDFDLN